MKGGSPTAYRSPPAKKHNSVDFILGLAEADTAGLYLAAVGLSFRRIYVFVTLMYIPQSSFGGRRGGLGGDGGLLRGPQTAAPVVARDALEELVR